MCSGRNCGFFLVIVVVLIAMMFYGLYSILPANSVEVDSEFEKSLHATCQHATRGEPEKCYRRCRKSIYSDELQGDDPDCR